MFGLRMCHSVTCSYARARRRTADSPSGGPMICMPIGKPLLVNPHGMVTAGRPSRLNGRVFGDASTSLARSWSGSAKSSETVNGGMGVVGVTTRFRVSNTLEIERR